jgi:hypothetical protein
MNSSLLDKVGEWNPQLFREIKGQLKPRNLILTVTISLIGQFIIYQLFSPSSWYRWNQLNWLLPLILMVGGCYQISKNLAEEEERGTLNFIRLSPQSSQNILIGKLLGVPLLLYIGIALAIPLHFLSGLIFGISWLVILRQYLLWGLGCCLFYNLALLVVIGTKNNWIGNAQTTAGMGIFPSLVLSSCYLTIIQSVGYIPFRWFFIPIGKNFFLFTLWFVMILGGATYFVWNSVNRRFRNPNTTLLSKEQSYKLVTALNLWWLGFVLPSGETNMFIGGITWLFFLSPVLFLILIAFLSPSHQHLLDWSRYRYQMSAPLNRSLGKDLLWGEKSPAIGAISLNLLITAALWIPWLLLTPESTFSGNQLIKLQVMLSLVVTMTMILIYTAIAQLILLRRSKHSGMWATGTVLSISILPLVLGGILTSGNMHIPLVFLFTPFPLLFFIKGSTAIAFCGFALQFVVLGLFSKRLYQLSMTMI